MTSSSRKGDWLQTFTGLAYWPADPRPEEVCIKDIAHSLAMQCRYGGHSRQFYSVAEHSVYVSNLVPPEHALVGLMHDATEAYVTDVPRPIKPYLENYAEIEQLNWLAIAAAFELPAEIPACVQDIDRRLCLREMRRVLGAPPLPLGIEGEEPSIFIACVAPDVAEQRFMDRFNQLWEQQMKLRWPAVYGRRAA